MHWHWRGVLAKEHTRTPSPSNQQAQETQTNEAMVNRCGLQFKQGSKPWVCSFSSQELCCSFAGAPGATAVQVQWHYDLQ